MALPYIQHWLVMLISYSLTKGKPNQCLPAPAPAKPLPQGAIKRQQRQQWAGHCKFDTALEIAGPEIDLAGHIPCPVMS